MGGEVGYQRWTSVDPWYLLPPITTFHPLLHGPSSSFVAWDGTRFPAKLGPRITIVSIHASSPRRGSGKTLFFSVIPFPRPLARPSLEKRSGYSTRSHDSSCGEDNSEGIRGGLRVLDMRVHRISRKALTEAGGSLLSSRVLSDTLYTSLANLPPFTACYQCYVTRFQPRTRDNIAIRNRRNERCTQPRAYHFVSQKRSLLARFTAISAQYAKLLPIHFSIQNLEETKRLWKRYGRDTLTHTRTRARIHRIAAISPARRNSPKLAAGPENCGKAPAQGRAQEGAYDSGVEWFTALPANRKYRWTRHARAGSGLRPRGHKLASSKASIGPRSWWNVGHFFPRSLFLARVPDLRSSIGPSAVQVYTYICVYADSNAEGGMAKPFNAALTGHARRCI